ncbi:MAG: glycosyltransferase [Moheibacter sp.]
MKPKRILFIGSINQGKRPKGGDQAKNQILLKKLKLDFGDSVYNFDVRKYKFTPLLIVLLLIHILKYKHIVISVNSSGLKMLGYVNFILKNKKTTFFLIGGITHIKMASIRIKKLLESACLVYAETREMVENIKKVSDKVNVSYLPNFKSIPKNLKPAEKKIDSDIRMVFLSRVREDKGIFKSIEIVKHLNSIDSDADYFLDIFGNLQLTDDEHQKFDECLKDHHIRYRGFLDFNENDSYLKLSEYHFMFFLTNFIGEGFPGVIVDAMIANVPVIASDFRYNKEVLEDEKGIIGVVLKMDSDWLSEASKQILELKNNPELYFETVGRMAESAKSYDIHQIKYKIC